MIISLSGRKGSGKSTLANLLTNHGYKKVSFADKLKELTAELYGWELTSLYDATAKEEILPHPVQWDETKAQKLAKLINATKPLNSQSREFKSRREALQFIGTEVLREYDSQFHVKEFKKRIDPNENYVMDDCRFFNELATLKSLNAHCVFVMRPYYFSYSNHISETELNRNHFDYVLINDRSESTLKKRFARHLAALARSSVKNDELANRDVLRSLLENKTTTQIANQLGKSRDAVVWWANGHLLPIKRNKYTHNRDAFSIPSKESAYWAGVLSSDGTIKKHLKYDYILELTSTDESLVKGFSNFLQSNKPVYVKQPDKGRLQHAVSICCPYIIEDMKLWCIEPRKSKLNKIPDCIRDSELIDYWVVGLIDGDGTICEQGTSFTISVLASLQIVEYLKNHYAINGHIYPEKDIENLYSLKYHGKYAVEFYNRVYRGLGLKRKWDKTLPFIDKAWMH